MNDRAFELKHQRLMDVQHARPSASWPENALRALEATELCALEATAEINEARRETFQLIDGTA